MNTSTRVLAVTAAASFAVFGVVGCSSDDNDSSTDTSSAAMTSSAMGSIARNPTMNSAIAVRNRPFPVPEVRGFG